jgi:hypothetical protein
MPRDQIALFSPTLDDAISEDHPLRLLDEILRTLNWSAWVVPSREHSGRPPIDPRILAGMQQREVRLYRSARYARRMHGAETPFAQAKGVVGVRQFLLRGRENVRTEWRWVCTALNVKKLLRAVAALRARLARWIAEPARQITWRVSWRHFHDDGGP